MAIWLHCVPYSRLLPGTATLGGAEGLSPGQARASIHNALTQPHTLPTQTLLSFPLFVEIIRAHSI